jgi:hypothetical protein
MKFRAHETFHIRKGWLNKGLYNVIKEPGVFLGDVGNPMDVMGIGSNMVKSLRYWLQAAGLTEEPNHGKRTQTLTKLGQIIYDNDPFFEEIGSLWLVHYMIASNEEDATAWYLFFNEFQMQEFSEDDFYKSLRKFITMQDGETMPSSRAISDDFKCIINTYYPGKRNSSDDIDPENNIECPLTELGLVSYVATTQGNRIYRKCTPKNENIPEMIALFVILKQIGDQKEVKISILQNSTNSIGKIFLLDTLGLLHILYQLESAGYIKVVRTAGLDVIRILTDLTPEECVKEYYSELNGNQR